MKVNMNCFTVDEIISHLEIYGDGYDGNIIRVINTLKAEKEYAEEEKASVEMELNDDTETMILQDENDELQEKLDRISEILKGE